MIAAASAWIREGTALVVPLIAFRNSKLARSMRHCVPCAFACALWDPPLIASSAMSMVAEAKQEVKKQWVGHLHMFTLLQHVPMFVGTHYYMAVVADGNSGSRAASDEVLYKPDAELARQAAVVGMMISACWFASDVVWTKLRGQDDVQFSPL
jgi:hypothetical protein